MGRCDASSGSCSYCGHTCGHTCGDGGCTCGHTCGRTCKHTCGDDGGCGYTWGHSCGGSYGHTCGGGYDHICRSSHSNHGYTPSESRGSGGSHLENSGRRFSSCSVGSKGICSIPSSCSCAVKPPCEESTKNTYTPVCTPCPTCPECAARNKNYVHYDPMPCPPEAFCGECYDALGKNLLRAAQAGQTQEVRRLLDAGAEVDFTFKSDWTALHRAAAHAHADVVAVLLKNGANYNKRTYCGFTALHISAFRDKSGRCVSILLNAGSFADICNEFQRTPLHYAAECGNEAAMRALVAAGAKKTNKDDKGRTPFDVAKDSNFRRLLRRL